MGFVFVTFLGMNECVIRDFKIKGYASNRFTTSFVNKSMRLKIEYKKKLDDCKSKIDFLFVWLFIF